VSRKLNSRHSYCSAFCPLLAIYEKKSNNTIKEVEKNNNLKFRLGVSTPSLNLGLFLLNKNMAKRQSTKVTRLPHLWIHNLVAQDRRLNASSKIVMMMLAMHADNITQTCYPSLGLLSRECRLEGRTIRTSLKKLEQYGYISIEAKSGKVNIYTLLEPVPNKYNSPLEEESEDEETPTPEKNEGGANNDIPPTKDTCHPPQNNTTNNTNITRLTNNTSNSSELPNEINSFIGLFREINPLYENLFANKTERKSAEALLKLNSLQDWESLFAVAPKLLAIPYCPKFSRPTELERQLPKFIMFIQQEREKQKQGFKIF